MPNEFCVYIQICEGDKKKVQFGVSSVSSKEMVWFSVFDYE